MSNNIFSPDLQRRTPTLPKLLYKRDNERTLGHWVQYYHKTQHAIIPNGNHLPMKTQFSAGEDEKEV